MIDSLESHKQLSESYVTIRNHLFLCGLLFAVSVLFGAKSTLEGRLTFWVFLGAAAIVVYPGILVIKKEWADKIYRGWIMLGAILGAINAKIIFTLCFYLIFTPIGFLLRLRQPILDMGWDPHAESYFTSLDHRAQWNDNYHEQS